MTSGLCETLRRFRLRLERRLIERALREHSTVLGASRALRVSRPHLYKRMAALGIDSPAAAVAKEPK